MTACDILVDTNNPLYLDQTVQQFGAALCGGGMPRGYTRVDGHYVVRCFCNQDFIKFAIENQGYGTVIKMYDGLYNDVKVEGEEVSCD